MALKGLPVCLLPSPFLLTVEGLIFQTLECHMEVYFNKLDWQSLLIRLHFDHSSRKDQFVKKVRKSIETGFWYPCLQDPDKWSDWNRFRALELLVAAVGLWQDKVLDHSFLLQNYTQLRDWFHR